MSRALKRFAAMQRNPAADWTIEDVAAVCREFRVECVSPGRGSHFRIAHRGMNAILTIPARRPLKAVYVRLFVDYIGQVEAASNHD